MEKKTTTAKKTATKSGTTKSKTVAAKTAASKTVAKGATNKTAAKAVKTAKAAPAKTRAAKTTKAKAAPARVAKTSAKRPVEKKSHTAAWIVGGVGIAAVVAVIVLACILLPNMGKADYGESYVAANELNDKLEEAYDGYSATCYEMLMNTSDVNLSVDSYNKDVEKCQKTLDEARDLSKKLGKTSGVRKDGELKTKYNEFYDLMAEGLPEAKKLEVYRNLHEFLLNSQTINTESTEEEIKKAAEPLTKSSDQVWVDFGNEWAEREINLIKAYKDYDQAKNSDGNYAQLYENYKKAMTEMQEFSSKFDLEDEELGGINLDKVNEMVDKFDDLRKAIRETYEKNYDGKNENDCVKANDGSVTCR